MDRQIENLKTEIRSLEQELTSLEREKSNLHSELSIQRNNLQVLQREVIEIRREWDEVTNLQQHEQDWNKRREMSRTRSELGTRCSAREIRVGDEIDRTRETAIKIREIEAKINNLIRLISNKKSELLSLLENEFRNQPSTSKFSFR